jgi:hypothetical protein
MPARAEYRALETIQVNGVNAYQPGDDVYAAVVENLGLEIGVDVEPARLKLIEKPAKNASRAAWAAYALDQGVSAEDVDGMGRDELVAFFEEEPVVVELDEDA